MRRLIAVRIGVNSTGVRPGFGMRAFVLLAVFDVGDHGTYGDFGARVRAGRDPINAAPVVSDGILLVQTASGDLSAWRVQ